MKKSDKKEFTVACDCGCVILRYHYWDDDTADIHFLEYYVSAFYRDQYGFWDRVKKKLSLLWMILRGKEFRFHELVLNKEDIENFKKFVEAM